MEKKSKTTGKSQQKQGSAKKGVNFELEEDADELFLKHFFEVKPTDKKADIERKDIGKRKGASEAVKAIDLHGLTLDEAFDLLQIRLPELLCRYGRVKVKIITGKGFGSQNGVGILAREVHRWVLREMKQWIEEIEDSPSSLQVNGKPIRGHFHVTLKK